MYDNSATYIPYSHFTRSAQKKPRTLFPAYAAFRRRHMHSSQVLHPPVQKFSCLLMIEVRNHLVEEVNQFGTRSPSRAPHPRFRTHTARSRGSQDTSPQEECCLAWELLLKLFSGKKYAQKNATQIRCKCDTVFHQTVFTGYFGTIESEVTIVKFSSVCKISFALADNFSIWSRLKSNTLVSIKYTIYIP